MQDLKTNISLRDSSTISTLWLGALAGILIKINRFFPDVSTFPPFFFIPIIDIVRNEED